MLKRTFYAVMITRFLGYIEQGPLRNPNPFRIRNPKKFFECTYYNTADTAQHGINTFSEPSLHLSTSVNNFMNQYPLSFSNIEHLNEKIDKPEGKAIHNCLDDANMTQQSMISFQCKQQFCMPNSQNCSQFYQNFQQANSQTCIDYKLLNFNQSNRQNSKMFKKSRVLFTQWQINELEKLFKKQKYVTSNERDLMAKRLKLHGNQIKIWFQNRRYKVKKKNEATDSES